ncbi:hypothetical protein Pmani_029218 [Petrolisthes manimaculis]|uniref:DM domain-containing protein n=1 Tax=Petrolisthes manimaculis TaxID=1843537 RepID=A0AAE1NZS4_9EUCA|nr:hypothetical protein Pmani_029218 [Petrolisthes manimaculis]
MQRTALMPSLKRMSMGPRKKFDFFNEGGAEPQPPLRPHPIHPKDPRRSQQQHPLQHYPSQRQLNPLPLANPSLQLSTNILVDTPSSYNTYEINDNNISDRVVSGGDVYGTTLIGTTTTTTNPSSISAGAGGAVVVDSPSSSTFLVPTRNSNTNTASSSLSAATVMGSSSPFLVPTRDSNTTTNTGPIYHEMSKSSGHVPSSRSSPDKDGTPLRIHLSFTTTHHSFYLPVSPSTEEDNRRKRKQRCRLCANHNIYKEVKGHKWYCEFESHTTATNARLHARDNTTWPSNRN